VALVTGAARGIGRAIAERLADQGAAVCVTDVDAGPVGEAAREMEAAGHRVLAVPGDVADLAACREAAEAAAEHLGGLHILVNNAGLTRDALVHKMGDDQWDLVQDVVLRGTFNCIRAVAPWFRDRERSAPRRIVSIASVSGIYGSVGNANYSAAKAGVIGLTRSVAREWARDGVTVNAVAPGYVETRLTAARTSADDTYGIPGDVRDALLARIPVGRGGTPEDIAHAVAFFCSPDSGYITGQVLEIDGGMPDITVAS
jgi:NAD(P)-dependent dehydrogenase (short-subunit alcohol dehydrogenase family)